MAESWKDKTVSLGNVEKEEFDSELAHVTVSENRIHVEFKNVEDWKRIKREVGEETILKEVAWEDVEGVDAETEHLYYPHVDVETVEGTKRLYFLEDEEELIEKCLAAVKRFWNVYRESGPRPRDSYSYEGGEGGEDVGDEDPEGEEAEIELEEDSEEEDEEEEVDRESVREMVEGFMEG